MEASGSIKSTARGSAAIFTEAQMPGMRAGLVAATVSSAALLSAFSGLMAFRRFWGGLQSAPTLQALIAVGVLLAVLAAVVHGGARLLCAKRLSVYRATQCFLPLSLAIAVFSICVPGSSFFGVFFVILILGCEELLWLLRPTPFLEKLPRQSADSQGARPIRTRKEKQSVEIESELVDFPPEVLRRVERSKGPAGEDICWGQIRSEFLPGQRTAAIHLEFCPPFQRTPVLHVEQVDGPDATVKTTQILPYGARLEVRLAQSGSEDIETRIEFSAIVEKDELV